MVGALTFAIAFTFAFQTAGLTYSDCHDKNTIIPKEVGRTVAAVLAQAVYDLSFCSEWCLPAMYASCILSHALKGCGIEASIFFSLFTQPSQ